MIYARMYFDDLDTEIKRKLNESCRLVLCFNKCQGTHVHYLVKNQLSEIA